MARKKKFIIACSFLFCIFVTLAVKVKAYDITEVSYIWDYLEKDTFFTGALRGVGWFIHVTAGVFLNLCYDTFTTVAQFDILKIPIVEKVITNLDILSPYIMVITVSVVLVVRLFDIKNLSKVFINMLVVTMLIAMFSHIAVLVNDMKSVGIAEAANVIGVEEYRISDALLADNTVDIKKSLDNGSVQYLDKNNVAEFKHDLRLSKDYLDEDITDKNPDGTYNTESLSSGHFGFGEVYFYRYKTDYWGLNITEIASIIIYIMAIFKMGYLLAQWMQENIFGGILMIKGIWDLRSVGKIFKSMLTTVFAIIEVYFMMLFFSYYCSNIMSSETVDNWLGKVILILAMGMMIIAGSGFINDSLGIDDGSNFMLRSMIIGRRLSQAAKAPFKMASGAAELGAKGISAVSEGADQLGSYLSSRYTGIMSNISNMDLPERPPVQTMPNNSPSPTRAYGSDGERSDVLIPQSRDVSYDTMQHRNDPKKDLDKHSAYSEFSSNNANGSGAPNDNQTMDHNPDDSSTDTPNDFINDLKDKYNESLYQGDQKYMDQNIPEAKSSDGLSNDTQDNTANEHLTFFSRDSLPSPYPTNDHSTIHDKRDMGNFNMNDTIRSNSVNSPSAMKDHGNSYHAYSKNDTVSTNPEHVKRMHEITNGVESQKLKSSEKEHNYPNADELEDLINSLNEWDQKGSDK